METQRHTSTKATSYALNQAWGFGTPRQANRARRLTQLENERHGAVLPVSVHSTDAKHRHLRKTPKHTG